MYVFIADIDIIYGLYPWISVKVFLYEPTKSPVGGAIFPSSCREGQGDQKPKGPVFCCEDRGVWMDRICLYVFISEEPGRGLRWFKMVLDGLRWLKIDKKDGFFRCFPTLAQNVYRMFFQMP